MENLNIVSVIYCRVSVTTFGIASGVSTIKSYQSDTMYACSIAIRGDIVILVGFSTIDPLCLWM